MQNQAEKRDEKQAEPILRLTGGEASPATLTVTPITAPTLAATSWDSGRRQAVPICEIILGDHFRKDLGDIDGLAESMDRRGQLQPAVITPDKRLVPGFGLRRLRAAEKLGWKAIWVVIADDLNDPLDLLLATRDAHVCQKPLLISEAMAMAEALLAMEAERARQRQLKGKPSSKLDAGRTDQKVARAIGLGGRTTFRRAKEILDALAAEPGNQELQRIVAMMDKRGRVKSAYDEYQSHVTKMRNAKIAAELREEIDQDINAIYPVFCGRFQNIIPRLHDLIPGFNPTTGFRTIFGDLLWDHPADYEDLAKLAATYMPDDGLVAVMTGDLGNEECKDRMKTHLKYRNDLVYYMPNNVTYVLPLNVNFNHKPMYVFCRKNCEKSAFARQLRWSVVVSDRADKRFHEFGLNVPALMKLVEILTRPGDTILDVAGGGGALAEACVRTGRRCITIEEHEEDCKTIRERILAVYSELKKAQELANTNVGQNDLAPQQSAKAEVA